MCSGVNASFQGLYPLIHHLGGLLGTEFAIEVSFEDLWNNLCPVDLQDKCPFALGESPAIKTI